MDSVVFVALVGHFPTPIRENAPGISHAGLDKRPTKTTKTTERRALSACDKGVLEGLKRPSHIPPRAFSQYFRQLLDRQRADALGFHRGLLVELQASQ